MPPSLNSAYRNVARVGRVKTRSAIAWGQESILRLSQQGIGIGRLSPYQPPYKVTLELFFKDKRICDIANREKLPIDLLVAQGVIEDDSKIDEMVIRRMGIDRENPRIEICIETLDPQIR